VSGPWLSLAEDDLSGSRFERVDLTGAEFRVVDLSQARFRGVDLSGAVMRGPNWSMSGSTVRSTRFWSTGSI
jgi:uncharacterized protein YjbI with pentapeptide repeats